MRQILFVCTGNICRSPMAEGQLRSLLAQSGNASIEVQSAGIGALAGQPPSQHAVEAMSEWGADITHQRSQMIHTDLVSTSEAIFGMTQGHVDAVLNHFPQSKGKTFLVREFVEGLEQYQKDISDPIGGDLEVYRHCRDEIAQGVQGIFHRLIESHVTASPSRLVIGADHAVFAAKEF